MVLQLTFNELLQLRDAQGAAIEVLDGRVWITEDGSARDSFLEPGRSYRVAGSGLVVVGADSVAARGAHFARVQVRKPARQAFAALLALVRGFLEKRRNETTRREMHRMSDRMLNDIGLSRAEIDRRFR